MASDVATPQAPAASSPAEQSSSFEPPPAGGPEYAEWRQTGKLPGRKTAAPAKESKTNSSETVPASEPGKTGQEHKRSAAAERLDELLDDLKRAGLTPAELKTFKRELKQEPKTEQQPSATPEKTDKPAAIADPTKPKEDDFEKLSDYFEALADWKAEKKLQQFKADQAQQQAKTAMDEKLAGARQRYGAEAGTTIQTAAKAVFGDKDIPGAVTALIDQSPVLVDLMYVLGSKADDLAQLIESAKRDPGAAIRQIVLLERLVQEELAKTPGKTAGEGKGEGKAEVSEETPERGQDGKFLKRDAPEKRDSEAPPPPKEVGGRGTTPTDATEKAFKDNDFTSFRSSRNRKDLEKRQGR